MRKKRKENNYAYIDGANLHKGILELGWRLDYHRFRVYLQDKYKVTRAYIFLGFISNNATLYRNLQDWGYIVIFKPTVLDGKGDVKGNCDAELVLQTVSDMYEEQYDEAIIVSGDGDFACLVNFLKIRKRLNVVLSPSHKKASVLLRKAVPNKIVFLERFRSKLQYKLEKPS